MSWVSGIHDRLTSCSVNPATSVEPRALARMLPCVSTTPLGSLVEPEENWMKAVSSAVTFCTLPAREMSSRSSTRKVRPRSSANSPCSPTWAAKAPMRSSARFSVYRKGLPRRRAMRSSLWRCSSLIPRATGTGTIPPSTAAQNTSMNCSLLARNRISLSPRRAPMRCRW